MSMGGIPRREAVATELHPRQAEQLGRLAAGDGAAVDRVRAQSSPRGLLDEPIGLMQESREPFLQVDFDGAHESCLAHQFTASAPQYEPDRMGHATGAG